MAVRHYIDLRPLWDSGALFCMALSDRSDGKSTAMATQCIKEFDNTGKRPVFSRRFCTEYTADFFDEFVQNIKNANPELLSGRNFDFCKAKKAPQASPARFLISKKGSEELTPAVDFIPLSMAGRYKSALGYQKNGNIYVDEYIPLDGRYLKDEAQLLLELYRTIDREHFTTRATIAGNKITRFNPVFDFFNIKQWKKGVNMYQNGTFALLVYSSKVNQEINQKSAFSDLVRGTAYEAYNHGEFLHTFAEIVQPKHSKLCVMRVSHGGKLYGVFVAGSTLVIDELNGNTTPCVCVCVDVAPPQHYAVWLEQAKGQREILERFKYNNALFFANDSIANKLKGFYKKI